MVDEFDTADFFDTAERGGGGLFFELEAKMAREMTVNDGMSEGRFPGAGNARETGENAEREVEREVFEVVTGGAADF